MLTGTHHFDDSDSCSASRGLYTNPQRVCIHCTIVVLLRSGIAQMISVVVNENFRGGANEGKSSRSWHVFLVYIF